MIDGCIDVAGHPEAGAVDVFNVDGRKQATEPPIVVTVADGSHELRANEDRVAGLFTVKRSSGNCAACGEDSLDCSWADPGKIAEDDQRTVGGRHGIESGAQRCPGSCLPFMSQDDPPSLGDNLMHLLGRCAEDDNPRFCRHGSNSGQNSSEHRSAVDLCQLLGAVAEALACTGCENNCYKHGLSITAATAHDVLVRESRVRSLERQIVDRDLGRSPGTKRGPNSE